MILSAAEHLKITQTYKATSSRLIQPPLEKLMALPANGKGALDEREVAKALRKEAN